MARIELPGAILAYLAQRSKEGAGPAGAGDICAHVDAPRPTVNRHLANLVQAGELVREGAGPRVVYRLTRAVPPQEATVVEQAQASDTVSATISPQWSEEARAQMAALAAPSGTRSPVTYQRRFVDEYRPNETTLLPAELAEALHAEGRSPNQQPAGTYARKVLEQLLIDLSWYSSRLEGNRKSLLDTRQLFAKGRTEGDDPDATMLLNHKEAIEFMVDAVPMEGMTVAVVRNIQSLLMQGLLANPASLGAIRKTIVNVSDTVYVPTQVPSLLEEMLEHVVNRARSIRNPVEAAFFLWVNLAYLQPFEDGNKRTSRLCANLPLLLSNCAPLSFLDVEQNDYALAMLGVYERLDVTLAVEMFAWTYRRSMVKYRTILDAMGSPDPLRAKYREQLGEAVRQIVFYGTRLAEAVVALAIPEADSATFIGLLRDELHHLEPYNCARFRLPIRKTEEWIGSGRPT